MLEKQQKLNLSQYTGLYDIIIPKNHRIIELHDIIDYEFIYEALHDKYCMIMVLGRMILLFYSNY